MHDVPNEIEKDMKCRDCGHVTDLKKSGCNFLISMRNKSLAELSEYMRKQL